MNSPGFDQHPHETSAPDAGKEAYIDAVRGWAILLVIISHVGGMFPEMPYPAKKLTNFGWHGVQMFFLASAVTLLMSWNRQSRRGLGAVRSFFVRRFLRIAPMYYMGALIYYVAEPPASDFDIAQMLRSFSFVNAWHPDWIPTTSGWMVVPGGWSIGGRIHFLCPVPSPGRYRDDIASRSALHRSGTAVRNPSEQGRSSLAGRV